MQHCLDIAAVDAVRSVFSVVKDLLLKIQIICLVYRY